MITQMILNLPVRDSQKSRRFFEEIGLRFNQKMTDENATCFDIDDNIVVALLPMEHFQAAVNNKQAIDATQTNEVLLSLGVESTEEVDAFAKKAAAAGGKILGEPKDYGPIYGATFADPDGHQWNIYHMKAATL
jgi:uncharacterized protein